MSNEHQVENLMKTTLENLKNMVDVNTVVGNPIETQTGTCIIPVSKLSLGFASGGAQNDLKRSEEIDKGLPFAGGSGAGVSVKPIGFLIISNDGVRMLNIDQSEPIDKAIDIIPQILDMIKSLLRNNKKEDIKDGNSYCEYENADGI